MRTLLELAVASRATEMGLKEERPKPPNGADDGLRTRDLQLGKLALYQLSYVRVDGYFSTTGLRG